MDDILLTPEQIEAKLNKMLNQLNALQTKRFNEFGMSVSPYLHASTKDAVSSIKQTITAARQARIKELQVSGESLEAMNQQQSAVEMDIQSLNASLKNSLKLAKTAKRRIMPSIIKARKKREQSKKAMERRIKRIGKSGGHRKKSGMRKYRDIMDQIRNGDRDDVRGMKSDDVFLAAEQLVADGKTGKLWSAKDFQDAIMKAKYGNLQNQIQNEDPLDDNEYT